MPAPSTLLNGSLRKMPAFLIVITFVLCVLGGYGYINQPIEEPAWPAQIPGFAFSPYQEGQSPIEQILPSKEDIASDLRKLQGATQAIRTYTVEGVFGEIPAMAKPLGLNVALGAWLSTDESFNAEEVDRLIKLANSPPYNVVRLVVGNEVLLREDLKVEALIAHLDKVNKATKIPISTAEPWHVWVKYPELADHVDYIAVHMLPFWEGISIENSVGHIVNRMNLLKDTFPNKPIVITEVGWPSHGRSIVEAEASRANEAIFLRRFISTAQQEGYVYYVMEAFDQPWKSKIEGSVGGHWGVYDVMRKPKFEMSNPIIAIPEWKFLAAASSLMAIVLVLLLFLDGDALQNKGKAFLSLIAFMASSLVIWIVYDFSQQYHDALSTAVGVVLLIGVSGVLLVIFAEAHEWAEAMWYRTRRRLGSPNPTDSPDLPFVSIHVPAYNEPPEMMIETLNALSKLDYPRFEVIVIDNNTPDDATWLPVQAHCASLGEHFKFYHERPLAGYKAGALNYALDKTHPEAEVVAVIDSDYVVRPDWLKHLAAEFANPKVAIVQAPQDYSDADRSLFKAMCYAEYKGFFQIGMITRNERNAIIQHGTMTMVRRRVLNDVGNWGTSTITEDAELGLRIFEAGHEAVYVPDSYGKGLMPDTFLDYKKQRYRWAYGAMQILREHKAELLNFSKSKLKPGQRYHFLAGWLPWIADGFNLLFTGLSVVWTLMMLFNPIQYNAPPAIISAIPIVFFAFKMAKMISLYMGEVRTGFGTALAAAFAGLGLSYTIARAVLSGLFVGRSKPFYRTPKVAPKAAFLKALVDSREEVTVAAVLLGLAVAVWEVIGFQSVSNALWASVLIVQAIPFATALVMSLISTLPAKKAPYTEGALNSN